MLYILIYHNGNNGDRSGRMTCFIVLIDNITIPFDGNERKSFLKSIILMNLQDDVNY